MLIKQFLVLIVCWRVIDAVSSETTIEIDEVKEEEITELPDENAIIEEAIIEASEINRMKGINKPTKRIERRGRKRGRARNSSALEKLKYSYIKRKYKIFLKPKIMPFSVESLTVNEHMSWTTSELRKSTFIASYEKVEDIYFD